MMKFNAVLFSLLLAPSILATFHRCYIEGTCPSGTYYYKKDSTLKIQCIECPEGYFMDQENHACDKCILCSSLTNKNEQYDFMQIKVKCNSTSDTEFRCRDGYCEDKLDGNICVKNTSTYCRATQNFTVSVKGPVNTTSQQVLLLNVTGSQGSRRNGSTVPSGKETNLRNSTNNATDAVPAGSQNVVVIVVPTVLGVVGVSVIGVIIIVKFKKCKREKEAARVDDEESKLPMNRVNQAS